MNKHSIVHIYTGKGKGKTTAALGLALRASGAGLKVYIAQFIQGRPYSEIKALKKFRNIKIEQFGRGCFITARPAVKDVLLAKAGLNKVRDIITGRKYNLIILDEMNVAVKFGLLSLKEVIGVLQKAPKSLEVVLTGRYAHPRLIKMADLVSEIRDVKHYYRKGVKARKGIEF